ncbi:TetR/AcrR family transcriptional regulator [Sporichthya polymorpha]|uniref:TetR/AcrR family transcriptional regulator n=1 Tax=Sporichthya polymorpha TaxID=35751 RepID=UPI0003680EFF|nr:TetR/AcrR family transcriptional regulator [Sporichthya polymorpha]
MSAIEESQPPRAGRLPRNARRRQLLDAALSVFVAQGYHAAAMDDIADKAGVSKPVLYQHFPGKRDLYLALLDESAAALMEAVRSAMSATDDNKERVRATVAAYYEFVEDKTGAFRLVFESDLIGEPEVRDRLEAVERQCAEIAAEVIASDTGLPDAEARLLGAGLAGIAQVTARTWAANGEPLPREQAIDLVASLAWRGIRGFPRTDDH